MTTTGWKSFLSYAFHRVTTVVAYWCESKMFESNFKGRRPVKSLLFQVFAVSTAAMCWAIFYFPRPSRSVPFKKFQMTSQKNLSNLDTLIWQMCLLKEFLISRNAIALSTTEKRPNRCIIGKPTQTWLRWLVAVFSMFQYCFVDNNSATPFQLKLQHQTNGLSLVDRLSFSLGIFHLLYQPYKKTPLIISQ